MFCASCGVELSVAARFCPACGAAQSAAPVARLRPWQRPQVRWAVGGTLLVVLAVLAGMAWRDRVDGVRLAREMDERRAAEARLQAELRLVRKRAEDVEQALIDAEQEAAQTRRKAGAVPVLVASEPKAARAAQARRQASERAQQDAAQQLQPDPASAAARAVAESPPAPASLPKPAPAPAAVPPVTTVASRAPEPAREAKPPPNPEAVCRQESNFIARAVCETRECIRPENLYTPYCRSLRARASPPGL